MNPPEAPEDAIPWTRRYRAMFENMAEGFAICEAVTDDDGRLVDYWIRAANPTFLRLGPDGTAAVGHRQRELRPDTADLWFSACARALAGKPVRFEFQEVRNGRWYEVHMARIADREFGQFFVDVTARKAAEARQAELFAELNHRVKNNLAIVSAILSLQARGQPAEVKRHLDAAADRIQAIAELHAALYSQDRVEAVSLCPYLEALCARLSASLLPDAAVVVEVRCEETALPVETAVSLGLIVNELLTNAAKHAFPAGRAGRVTVTYAAGETCCLEVLDNGVGLQGRRADRLGLRIVRALAASLGGAVEARSHGGLRVRVRFAQPPA